ncbi:hypothetical protein BH23ACT9_BH23ACT9_00240 [soil metagenome]
MLKWSAAEAAALLETSVASVNSALQRARATLAKSPTPQLDPIDTAAHAELLARYVDAFERYDIDQLVTLLRDDVVLSMPPFDMWLVGPQNLAGWFLEQGAACRGSKLLPVTVSGTAGFGSYKAFNPGVWEPWALQVIEVVDGRISGHHNFLCPQDPAVFARYGLPPRIG